MRYFLLGFPPHKVTPGVVPIDTSPKPDLHMDYDTTKAAWRSPEGRNTAMKSSWNAIFEGNAEVKAIQIQPS